MKKVLIAMVIVLVLGAVYAGVYIGAAYFISDKFMPGVAEFVSAFYEHRDDGDINYIYLVMTDKEFRDQVGQDTFTQYLETLTRRLGKVLDRTKAGVRVTRTAQGRYITASYRVRYKNVETLEGFTIKDDKGTLSLVDYGIYWSDKDLSREMTPTSEDYEDLKTQIYDMIDKEAE
jgi:hypothetical protein